MIYLNSINIKVKLKLGFYKIQSLHLNHANSFLSDNVTLVIITHSREIIVQGIKIRSKLDMLKILIKILWETLRNNLVHSYKNDGAGNENLIRTWKNQYQYKWRIQGTYGRNKEVIRQKQWCEWEGVCGRNWKRNNWERFEEKL